MAINEGAVPENGMPGIQYAYGRVVNDDRPRHQGLGLNTGKPGGGGNKIVNSAWALNTGAFVFFFRRA